MFILKNILIVSGIEDRFEKEELYRALDAGVRWKRSKVVYGIAGRASDTSQT
jgi:hypothetical protein